MTRINEGGEHAREGRDSYHYGGPHTELHPESDERREKEESRFFYKTEVWLR